MAGHRSASYVKVILVALLALAHLCFWHFSSAKAECVNWGHEGGEYIEGCGGKNSETRRPAKKPRSGNAEFLERADDIWAKASNTYRKRIAKVAADPNYRGGYDFCTTILEDSTAINDLASSIDKLRDAAESNPKGKYSENTSTAREITQLGRSVDDMQKKLFELATVCDKAVAKSVLPKKLIEPQISGPAKAGGSIDQPQPSIAKIKRPPARELLDGSPREKTAECGSYPTKAFDEGSYKAVCRWTQQSHLNIRGEPIITFVGTACARGVDSSRAGFNARARARELVTEMEIEEAGLRGAKRETNQVFVADANQMQCEEEPRSEEATKPEAGKPLDTLEYAAVYVGISEQKVSIGWSFGHPDVVSSGVAARAMCEREQPPNACRVVGTAERGTCLAVAERRNAKRPQDIYSTAMGLDLMDAEKGVLQLCKGCNIIWSYCTRENSN